jgi:hypothetical protein
MRRWGAARALGPARVISCERFLSTSYLEALNRSGWRSSKAKIRPEAAYFTVTGGNRGGFIVANLDKTSDRPRLAEPWFLSFDATGEFLPVMTPEDLQREGRRVQSFVNSTRRFDRSRLPAGVLVLSVCPVIFSFTDGFASRYAAI